MFVDDLVDIEWNSQAFDKLVLSDAEKRLMLGFVGANKNGQLKDFDDFVDGKGSLLQAHEQIQADSLQERALSSFCAVLPVPERP
mgnify:CR=1 FL=1